MTEPFGKGVHTAYEGKMLNNHIDTLMGDIDSAVGNAHGMQFVNGGQEAGYAVVELMKRTYDTINPMKVVNVFGEARENHENGAEALWVEFETETRDVIADGCRVLAMLWESAWREGTQRQTIDPDRLRAAPASRLMELYSDQNFLPSVSLDEIGTHL